jgi:hypothetical protein
VTELFVTWLIEGGVGPALVSLPVNWAAAEFTGASKRWLRRLRRTDDLSLLVRAAIGNSEELTQSKFDAVRRLLEDPETWRALGQGSVEDLVDLIAACLSAGDDQAAGDWHAPALIIARGLLELAVADLDPKLFQRLLLTRLQRMEAGQATALDKALFDVQADLITGFGGMMDQFKRVLAQLPPEPAHRGEIAAYLMALIDWLNTDPWPRDPRMKGAVLTPATIERGLRVTSRGQTGERDLDADDLATQCQRLMILGGPGSGKTWLAKRTARRCAEDALAALAADAALDEIELPLYTTCSRLFSASSGDIRAAALSSALDQVGDLGGDRIRAEHADGARHRRPR